MTKDNEEPSAASAGSTGGRHEFRAWLDTSGFRAAFSRIAAAFRKQSVAARPHGPPFSTRSRMEEAAAEWCRNAGVPPTPFNVVTALSSLGLLAEQERIQEWLHG